MAKQASITKGPRAGTADRGNSAGGSATRGVSRNEVTLWGRVAAPAEERELPSGDSIVTARIIIDRDASARSRSAQRVDTLDCVGWTTRVQRAMRTWSDGDWVQVEGSMRRRFFRGVAGTVSRVEVEVLRARRSR